MIQFTEAMIIKGLEQGLVNLILSPHGDGIVCKIGKGTCSNWFYFGGVTAAECNNVEEYKKQVPQATIIKELIRVLNDFHHIDEDEQLFYYYVLKDSKAMSIHDVSEKCDYWISEAMKQLIKDNIDILLDGEIIHNVLMEGKLKQLFLSSMGKLTLKNEQEE